MGALQTQGEPLEGLIPEDVCEHTFHMQTTRSQRLYPQAPPHLTHPTLSHPRAGCQATRDPVAQSHCNPSNQPFLSHLLCSACLPRKAQERLWPRLSPGSSCLLATLGRPAWSCVARGDRLSEVCIIFFLPSLIFMASCGPHHTQHLYSKDNMGRYF